MSDICEAPSALRNDKDIQDDPRSKTKSKSNFSLNF